jgi:ATP-binding cassette subfamily C protein EexD
MWDRGELGAHLGYLPQDFELFEGTVAENVARFAELDSLKIVDAAMRAGVHEMILTLSHGYETRVGPNGIALSGGQRQRIALARALYGNPVLVVLDEPNSNLDSAGDQALAEAIDRMKREGTTVVLISHRAKVLRHSNHMLMLKDATAIFVENWQQHRSIPAQAPKELTSVAISLASVS